MVLNVSEVETSAARVADDVQGIQFSALDFFQKVVAGFPFAVRALIQSEKCNGRELVRVRHVVETSFRSFWCCCPFEKE